MLIYGGLLKMLNIAICDDEKQFCDILKKQLSHIMSSLNEKFSLYCYYNGVDFKKTELNFDIVFLDIQMEDISGINLAKEIRIKNKDIAIIFISSFKNYVFDVFEFEATDYLCKPINNIKLKQATERAIFKIKDKKHKNLLIQSGNCCKSINMGKIYYCEVINRKIYIHTVDGIIDYYGKIEDLENQVDIRFFRCHRSYLINLDYFLSYRDGQIMLENKGIVPLSRLRKKEFMKVMLNYLKNEV